MMCRRCTKVARDSSRNPACADDDASERSPAAVNSRDLAIPPRSLRMQLKKPMSHSPSVTCPPPDSWRRSGHFPGARERAVRLAQSNRSRPDFIRHFSGLNGTRSVRVGHFTQRGHHSCTKASFIRRLGHVLTTFLAGRLRIPRPGDDAKASAPERGGPTGMARCNLIEVGEGAAVRRWSSRWGWWRCKRDARARCPASGGTWRPTRPPRLEVAWRAWWWCGRDARSSEGRFAWFGRSCRGCRSVQRPCPYTAQA